MQISIVSFYIFDGSALADLFTVTAQENKPGTFKRSAVFFSSLKYYAISEIIEVELRLSPASGDGRLLITKNSCMTRGKPAMMIQRKAALADSGSLEPDCWMGSDTE